MTTENYFYLDSANQPVGPLGLDALAELASSRMITPDTLVAQVGGSEWVPLKSATDTPEGAAPVATAQDERPVLLPKAYAIAQKAKVNASEFSKNVTVEFPTCSGGLLSRCSAYFASVYDKGDDGQPINKNRGVLGLVVHITRGELVIWDRATLPGGDSLMLKEIRTEFVGNSRVTQLALPLIHKPMLENMHTGLRIRLSSSVHHDEEILDISPEHIQAVLYYQNPDAFTYDPGATKAAVEASSFTGQLDNFNQKLGMFLWAFCSWIFAANGFFALPHLFRGNTDALYMSRRVCACGAVFHLQASQEEGGGSESR